MQGMCAVQAQQQIPDPRRAAAARSQGRRQAAGAHSFTPASRSCQEGAPACWEYDLHHRGHAQACVQKQSKSKLSAEKLYLHWFMHRSTCGNYAEKEGIIGQRITVDTLMNLPHTLALGFMGGESSWDCGPASSPESHHTDVTAVLQ